MRPSPACLFLVLICSDAAAQNTVPATTPPIARLRSESEARNEVIFRQSTAVSERALGSICTGCGVSARSAPLEVRREAPADRRSRLNPKEEPAR